MLVKSRPSLLRLAICVCIIGSVTPYQACYYCELKNLGICAKYDIKHHREVCGISEPEHCHTISTITVHAGGSETYLKHCNRTISICSKYRTNKGSDVLYCCSECHHNKENIKSGGRNSAFRALRSINVLFITCVITIFTIWFGADTVAPTRI